VSDNLRRLGEYSARMFDGDEVAVLDFFSDDFESHVTARVAPDAVGTDIRRSRHRYPRRGAEVVAQRARRVPRHEVHR